MNVTRYGRMGLSTPLSIYVQVLAQNHTPAEMSTLREEEMSLPS